MSINEQITGYFIAMQQPFEEKKWEFGWGFGEAVSKLQYGHLDSLIETNGNGNSCPHLKDIMVQILREIQGYHEFIEFHKGGS